MALSVVLGLMKSGMPGYDSMCEKSSNATPAKMQPTVMVLRLVWARGVCHVIAKIMPAKKMEAVSNAMCSGR